MRPRGGLWTWYIFFYMDMMRLSNLWWWLRSTTGSSYRWPVIEVAYGEIIFHSTEAVWETLAREEWLGCRHDTAPMVDIPRSTSVWAQYMIFFGFHDIKIYMYYVLKSIFIIKKNTSGLWLCLDPTMFKEDFRLPMMF